MYFRVSEKEYLDYAANPDGHGKEVTFKLADGTPLDAKGVIDTVETEIDAAPAPSRSAPASPTTSSCSSTARAAR